MFQMKSLQLFIALYFSFFHLCRKVLVFLFLKQWQWGTLSYFEASCLPEVAGNDAQFFDPLDHRDLSGKISALISNENLLVTLSQKGIERSANFSWKFVSSKLLEALKSYSCENGPQEKKGLDGKLEKPCKKLAYISPLPPEKSGVANYSNDLLQSLKKFYEIHLVFITQYKAEERPKILDDFVHVSVDQFKANVLHLWANFIPFRKLLFSFILFRSIENLPRSCCIARFLFGWDCLDASR